MEYNESNKVVIADYYSLHYEELKLFVQSRLQSMSEVEDIVQNVFVRLLLTDKMITPVTLPCLVYTITKNLITDYWRRKHKLEEYEHVLQKADWQNYYTEDGESVYSVREITEILEQGITQLSNKQRSVYRLNIDGMQVGEIATQLDISYRNVEKRLGSARKKVREYVQSMLG